MLVAELAHRLWFYGPAGLVPARLSSVRPLGETDFTVDAEEPGVVYRLRPGLEAWFKLQRFTTSSAGLRDREYDRAKPEGTFRIAVIGDSYTMGSGVADDEIYHALLEEALNAEAGATSYELINFGVGGYNLLQELGVIEHEALGWDPDLILLAVVENDEPVPPLAYFRRVFPGEPELARHDEPPLPPPAPTRFLRLTLLDRFLKPRADERAGNEPAESLRAQLARELALRAALGPDAAPTAEGEYVQAVFDRIAAVCARADVPVFCVYLATDEAEASVADTFARAAGRVGFGFLDTCGELAGIDRGDIIILPDDGHPNARSHRRYAEALEGALRAGGWLSPRESGRTQ